MQTTLPEPNTITRVHSEKLLEKIIGEIKQKGPITFARYMQLALYAPGLGYYSAGARKFGEAGDFVTAPEISPLFSQCIARQCMQVLNNTDSGVILELGAGTGMMAHDILKELQRQNCLPEKYYILELSADLRERQQILLQQTPDLYQRITWLDALPEQLINGVILGNEVIDAMPVHKFKQQNELQEYYVDYQNGKLCWQLAQPSFAELTKHVAALNIDFANGYESEINMLLPSWLASLADCLNQGLMLFIDYGYPRHEYYHPDRHMGTIMCHYQHRAHSDPLILTGLQDITAHVDFTAIAEAATDNNLNVSGFTNQAAFLINCGITEFIQTQDTVEHFNLSQQIKRLTLPSEMGELFKAIALTKNYDESLLGFRAMNQVRRI